MIQRYVECLLILMTVPTIGLLLEAHYRSLQAQFDPATAARLQTGSEMQPRGGASFGFRMPASLLPRTTQQQAHCMPTAAHDC